MHVSEGVFKDIRFQMSWWGCNPIIVSIEKQTWVLCKSTDLVLTISLAPRSGHFPYVNPSLLLDPLVRSHCNPENNNN